MTLMRPVTRNCGVGGVECDEQSSDPGEVCTLSRCPLINREFAQQGDMYVPANLPEIR